MEHRWPSPIELYDVIEGHQQRTDRNVSRHVWFSGVADLPSGKTAAIALYQAKAGGAIPAQLQRQAALDVNDAIVGQSWA